MKYLRVKWLHSNFKYPTVIYSEVDEAGWEIRKVEVFMDGRMQYAGRSVSNGKSMLSKEPLPSIIEISGDPQFDPVEITENEFDRKWHEATK